MAKVLEVVRATLSDLKLAIEGTIIMSSSLREGNYYTHKLKWLHTNKS